MSANFTAPYLHALSRTLLEAADVPRHIAHPVSDVLVGANLVGHDSHGVLRIPAYLRRLDAGDMIPDAEPEVVHDNGNAVIMDGRSGKGIYTCLKGTEFAIERAKDVGMCVVTFKRIHHIGRLGHYVEMAARAGCVGFVTVGRGATGDGIVLPYGSKSPTFGTNPIAWGIPTGDDTPFILDYATSVVAEGKLQVARSRSLSVPEGTIVDKHGTPTTDPLDFYDGGSLLPFSGHKGSAMLMLPCLLGSLAGDGLTYQGMTGGCFVQMIDVERFTDLEAYQRTVRAFLDDVKGTEPADGFDEVLVPGDFEALNRADRLQTGIEIPQPILDDFDEWGEKLGVDTSSIDVLPEDEIRYR